MKANKLRLPRWRGSAAAIVCIGFWRFSGVAFGEDVANVSKIHIRFLPPWTNTVSVVHAKDLVQPELMPLTSEMTLVDPDAQLIAKNILTEAGVTNETVISGGFPNDKMDTTAVFEFVTGGPVPIRIAYKFTDRMEWVNIEAKPLTKSQIKELLSLLPAFVWKQIEDETKAVHKPK